jgi:hypothetical protein
MRESEMRQRAESLIRRGMQGMISPSLALSLALAGCGGSDYMAQIPRHDSGVFHDGGSISDTPLYAAPIPDARPDQGLDVSGLDQGLDVSGLDQGLDTSRIDTAVGPDLGIDGPVIDASNEAAGHDADESARG